jgi:RHS repeat-associated protein
MPAYRLTLWSRGAVAVGTALALVAGLCGVPAQAAEPKPHKARWSAAAEAKPVRGTAVRTRPRPADPAAAGALAKAPAVTWPKAGSAEVSLSGARTAAVRAGGLPVSIAPRAGGPRRVKVELLDRSAAEQAGVDGVLFRVRRTDGAAGAGPVAVDVDYSGFRHAFGGDYAARLTLVRLPACAASTPKRPECVAATPLRATNDVRAGRIRGDVTTADLTTADAVYAVTSSASGSAGSFKPTSLSPSAMWEVGLQSGAFNWSYPLEMPPAAGMEPSLALSYSSGAVDGRTTSTNNQASWIGDGFDLQPGFIERQYTTCGSDMDGGNNTTATTDLCYASANATVALPGVAGELVWDAGKRIWRAEEDDGWRVEQLFGANNGDNDGEHWRLTSPEGTQYFFGRATAAKSAWTVPVFGNQAGEPCNAAAFATSWCQQAYRWMLDYVVDRHGDAMAYHYDTETNHYGRGGASGNATPYVRAGQITRIDYGLRDGQSEPAARVVFTAADRCIPGSPCQRSQPADWPDVPWDQQCDGGVCTGTSPVFFGTKRLAKVTTQVRDGGQLKDVDSWTLKHLYPVTNDTAGPSLWLESIVHTGHVGGQLSTPEVNFDGLLRDNRLEVIDGEPWMRKWRLVRINTETGGQIDITYSANCTAGTVPAADTNGRACFPVYWTPAGATQPRLDWFHKYLVTQVREIDRVGGSPDKFTSYEYAGDAAWHHDDAELVPDELKTWGQWRGYQTVKVRTGAPGGARTLVEHRFFRGMHGDKKLDGTTKTDKLGGQDDLPVLRGFAHEEITYNGDGGPEIERELNEPVVIGPNAIRRRASGDLSAYTTEVKRNYTRTVLADGGYRETEKIHSYDAYGVHILTDDRGDLSTSDDDRCQRTSYTANKDDWLIGLPHRVETVSVACAATPNRPTDVISDVRVYYDGSDTLDAAPTKGDATRGEELSSWGANGAVYTTMGRKAYDAHGREIESYDALGNKETTAYTPAVGGPVTEVETTNALGHRSLTRVDPATGSPVLLVDADGKRSEMVYDALGRLVKAWGPGRSSAESPEVEFQYLLRNDGPSVITTRTLLNNGGYRSDRSLLDGLLRQRQTQSPAPGGGRLVADTIYDSHGRVVKTNSTYHNDDAPGTDLLVTADEDVPGQTVFVYDGVGRETAEIFRVKGIEKWRTTTTYGGNWTRENPPAGGTPTTEVFDAEGKVIELRQHKSGAAYDSTRYTYTPSGEPASVTDPAGNVWRHHYDLRGREIRVDDPDKGTATMTYDDEDRLLTTTDSRGRMVASAYDVLGRKTATYEGSTGGTQLTEQTYDSLRKGLPVASTRFVNGQAYRSEVTGYNDRGQVTGTAVTIPAAEGALAGRYTSTSTYNDVGQVTSVTQPGAGGLPDEILAYGYDELGQPISLTGAATYVEWTRYTPLGELAEYILGGVDGKRMQQSFEYETGTHRMTVSRARDELSETPAVERRFEYDPAGNLKKLVTAARDRQADTQCYDIDHLERLTEAWTATDDCAGGPSLDNLGGPAPYWHSYTFDKVGNRLTEKWHAAAGDTTRTYSYPMAGSPQPHTLLSVTSTGLGGSRTDSYGYDADGNTTSRPGQTLVWNSEGLLESVTAGSDTTSYLYDAEGERLIRREAGATTLFLGSTELRWDRGTGSVDGTRYYAFHGATVAIRTEAGLSWVFADHHGTGETVVDADTQAVSHRLHLPFGAPRGGTPPAWPGDKGFVGGTKDATGLTHLGAREYDPLTGRFISVDPIINVDDPQQMHGYAYANNNPASLSDPDGLEPRPGHAKPKTKKPKAKVKKAKSTKPKSKPTPRCGNPRQCDGSNAKIAKDVKKMKARANKAAKRYCSTPSQCDNKDAKKVKARNAAAKRKCANPRQCDGSNAKIAKDVKKMKNRDAAKLLGDAGNTATVLGSGPSGAASSDKAAEKWKKKWWASRHAHQYRNTPAMTTPGVKWSGRGLGVVGAAMTFNSNVAGGDGLAKAAVKTGVDAGAVLIGAKTGAAIGAVAGSFFPVVGTAAGAFIGAVAGTVIGMGASVAATEAIDSVWEE